MSKRCYLFIVDLSYQQLERRPIIAVVNIQFNSSRMLNFYIHTVVRICPFYRHLTHSEPLAKIVTKPLAIPLFFDMVSSLTRAPLGGAISSPPSRFLAISSKPMQLSPPNLQYPLSQHFYTLC